MADTGDVYPNSTSGWTNGSRVTANDGSLATSQLIPATPYVAEVISDDIYVKFDGASALPDNATISGFWVRCKGYRSAAPKMFGGHPPYVLAYDNLVFQWDTGSGLTGSSWTAALNTSSSTLLNAYTTLGLSAAQLTGAWIKNGSTRLRVRHIADCYNVVPTMSADYINIQFYYTVPASITKVWNGSSWETKIVKAYTGSTWVEASLKGWNGSSWKG